MSGDEDGNDQSSDSPNVGTPPMSGPMMGAQGPELMPGMVRPPFGMPG